MKLTMPNLGQWGYETVKST